MEDIHQWEKKMENRQSAVQEVKEAPISPSDVTSFANVGDVRPRPTVTSPTLPALQLGESVARKITGISQRIQTGLDGPEVLQHRLNVMEARLFEQQRALSDMQSTIVQTSHHNTDPAIEGHLECEQSASVTKEEIRDPVCHLQLSDVCDDLRLVSKQQMRLAAQLEEIRDAQRLLQQSTYPLLTDLQRDVHRVQRLVEQSHHFPEDRHPLGTDDRMDHTIKRHFVYSTDVLSTSRATRVAPEDNDCRDLGSRTPPPMYEPDRFR